MKVLMLGWEYPPHISGGLGTACEGLTIGLSRHDVDILFVVPSLYGGERAGHMQLVDSLGNGSSGDPSQPMRPIISAAARTKKSKRLKTLRIPSFLSPYLNEKTYKQAVTAATKPNLPAFTSIFDLATESARISSMLEILADSVAKSNIDVKAGRLGLVAAVTACL